MNKFNTADLCDDYKLVVAKPIFKSFGSHTHCYGRIKTVEAKIKEEKHAYLKKKLDQRLAMLSGAVGVVKVGANSKIELKEKKDRV